MLCTYKFYICLLNFVPQAAGFFTLALCVMDVLLALTALRDHQTSDQFIKEVASMSALPRTTVATRQPSAMGQPLPTGQPLPMSQPPSSLLEKCEYAHVLHTYCLSW